MRRKTLFFVVFLTLFVIFGNSGIAAKTAKLPTKPLIGISGSMLADANYVNYYYSYVSDYYVKAVVAGGGIPVIIPIVTDMSVIPEQIRGLDGLILSGGADINPLKYGEEPSPALGRIHHERDKFDYALLKSALKREIPVLGICRGHQLINTLHGGTLHQDVESAYENAVEHRQRGGQEYATHTVSIEKGSWLYSVLGKENIATNSLHHQAVKDLAQGFKITALAKDGVVEGIEKEKGSFCVGVQWHPEMMQGRDSDMLELCKAFIKICKKNTE